MSLPVSSELHAGANRAAPERLLVVAALAWLGACSSTAPRSEPAAQPAVATAHAVPPAPVATAVVPASATAGGTPPPAAGADGAAAPAAPAPRPQVSPAARADFDRAVSSMRAGNTSEAELGFKQVALQYPQFAAPLVNLAILERKEGSLEGAENSLKSAVARESDNPLAWTELGATQRMRGEFQDAAASYEHAIAANPRYAPAWRNLGVLSDLYLGDPERALKAFEQYKEITGEEKPVSGWIAELRQRLGLPPVKRETAPATPGSPPSQGPEAAPAASPAPEPTPGAQPQPGASATGV